MGRYFNPATAEAIESAGGRRLSLASHEALMKQLGPDERLGMFLTRIRFEQMPDVTDPYEFDEFNRQCNDGIILLIRFYAMPRAAFGLPPVAVVAKVEVTQ